MDKTKITAEELNKVVASMRDVMKMTTEAREKFIAETIGSAYDYELPIPKVIESIAQVKLAGNRPESNHIYYLTPVDINKMVFTLTSNCNVTQVQVTPNSRVELNLVPIVTNDYWICLQDFTSGDYDALAVYADAISEALNRYEIKNVLALLDAGAVAQSNTFTPDSGDTELDYLKIVDMVRSLARYGSNFVLITGANVTTDVLKMDFRANTFREYGLSNLNIKHIPIEDLTVDTNASGQEDVIDPDTAYLVAVSDSMKNRPLLVARRDLRILMDIGDNTLEAQYRIIIDTGNIKNVGSVVKFARGKAGYEEFGAVLINAKTVAKFTK